MNGMGWYGLMSAGQEFCSATPDTSLGGDSGVMCTSGVCYVEGKFDRHLTFLIVTGTV